MIWFGLVAAYLAWFITHKSIILPVWLYSIDIFSSFTLESE